MKSYPYIGVCNVGFGLSSVALFADKNKGALLKRSSSSSKLYVFTCDYEESSFQNITTEYLANTYGEVKSKEHAEFIVKLAKVNGIVVFKDSEATRPKDIKYFSVTSDGILYFWNDKAGIQCGRKQITIPLPPERESVDEWPKVGDEAILANENDYGVTYGAEAIGKKVKVMSLFKDGDLDMAAIKHDITNYCFRVDMLQKPKTPEQELRDFISLLWDENNHDFDMFLDIVTEHVIKNPQ